MLHPLIHRQDGQIPAIGQAPGAKERLQGAQHAGLHILLRHDAIHVIGAGKVQQLAGNALALVIEQAVGFAAEQSGDVSHGIPLSLVKNPLHYSSRPAPRREEAG
jgi:hypothetical protein